MSTASSVYNDSARLSKVHYPGSVETTSDRRTIGYGYSPSNADAIYERLNNPIAIWSDTYNHGTSAVEYTQKRLYRKSAMGRMGYASFVRMSNYGGTDVLTRPWLAATDDGYDRFGRTAQVKYTGGGTKAELNYGYDAGSNRTYREDVLAAAQTTPQDLDELYGYDDLSRLNHFQVGDVNTSTLAATNLDREQAWPLDQLGNWSAFNEDADGDGFMELEQDRTANDANEITGITAATGIDWVDPAYDAAGNMTKRPDPEDPDDANDAHDITYDAWNRVVRIEDSTGTIATYEYDGLGRRIEKTVGSDTYDYYHNESWQVVEVRKNDDANPLEQFVYDTNYIDAVAFRWYDADTDGDTNESTDGEQYYLYDASFNVIALLEADGDVIERYRYTPYGERIVLDADFSADADNVSDYGQQRGFQGLLHDEESGLIENRARMLDPMTGRFVQRDPLGYPDGMNSYAAYHVLRGTLDPYGLWEWPWSENASWDVRDTARLWGGATADAGRAVGNAAQATGQYVGEGLQNAADTAVARAEATAELASDIASDAKDLAVETAQAAADLVDTVSEQAPIYKDAIYKQYYCGNDLASDDEYEDAVEAAGDWWYRRGATRGGYAGVRQKIAGNDQTQIRFSAHGQWTMDEGYGGGAGFGLAGKLPGDTTVTLGPPGASGSWTQDGGVSVPDRWGVSVSQGNGRITGRQSEGGLGKPTVGFTCGRFRAGLIVDPERLEGNAEDAWDNRGILWDLISEGFD